MRYKAVMQRLFLILGLLTLLATGAHAATPTTTTVPTTLQNTPCTSTQLLFGNGSGVPPVCGTIGLANLPSLSANTVLGALTATTPSGLALPSCSTSVSALIWTSGTGFGCNTISSPSAGTLNLATYPGVTVGAGQTTGVRQTNCTNINAAISYAETNGLQVLAPIGVYEISCAGGISIPYVAGGFSWRGNRSGSVFVQYYSTSPGGPILTIGDVTGTNVFNAVDFDGGVFKYGVSQSGLTSSETVQIGAMTNSKVSGLTVGAPSNPYPGYDGLLLNNGSNANIIASSFGDITVNGAQRTLLNASNALGPSNTFSNTYLSNGVSGTYGTLSGYCLTLGTTISTEPKFTGLTCSWISGNVILDLEDAVGAVLENVHLEGIKSTGASPILVQTVASDVRLGAVNVKNWVVQSANFTGTAKAFRDASATPSNVQVQSLNFLQTVSGNVTTSFVVNSPDAPADDNGTYSIRQMRFQDTTGTGFAGNVVIDSHMPSANFLTPERTGLYTWGAMGSNLDKAVIPVSATYTYYGELTGATLEVPVSVTSFTLTLQAVQAVTGNQPVAVGSTVHVRRQAGSASGTLTIQDDAGDTLATNTTAAADYWFIFNGSHFISFTPVT